MTSRGMVPSSGALPSTDRAPYSRAPALTGSQNLVPDHSLSPHEPATLMQGAAQPATLMHGAAQPATLMHGAAQPATLMHGAAQPATLMHGAAQPATLMHGAAQPTTLMHGTTQHGPLMHGAAHTSPLTHGAGTQPLHLTYGAGRPHMGKSDISRSFSSDETALNKQIIATHAADYEDLNIKPVLAIAEDLLRLGTPLIIDTSTGAVQAHLDTVDHKIAPHGSHTAGEKFLHGSSHQDEKALLTTHHDGAPFLTTEHDAEIIKYLAFPINKISCEIICKCSAGSEAHSVTMDLLRSLSNYSWDAKAVIVLAAFAINYGEFWLVEQLHTNNPLAKNIAILKDLPDIMEHSGEKKFNGVLDLLKAVSRIIHCIISFKELPTKHISPETPEMAAAVAYIPIAVYWVIKSLLACASILLNLIGSGHEYLTSTAESWEILSLTHKLSVILEYLQKHLADCKRIIGIGIEADAYALFKKIMEQSHIDNMKVLRAMIRAREEQRPLYDGTKRTNERLEVLRLKYVLLLISDLELPHEELNVLHLIYSQQAMRHEYEVLWLPIVHPKTLTTSPHVTTAPHSPQTQDTVFYDLRNNNMPWYSVEHPSLIEPVAVRYIREVWNFEHMPMVVVLDPQGRASNLDALPMMWIWGSNAFPFTKIRERALWADVNWTMELLADSIDPRIPEWIRDNKVICLYGGEDIEWIRKFTLSARAVANALHIPLEMLYVGKRNPRAKVQHCHEVIDREKLSHVFSVKEYYDYVWYFWVRLWSMWNSKKQLGMTVDNDHIMQEIMDILMFDSSDQGWAVFSRGNYEMTKGMGDVVLSVLDNYQYWAHNVDHPDKFVLALKEAIHGTHPEHHCNKLILPSYTGYIPEKVVCSECGKMMDKYVMYRCCTD